MRHGRNRFQIFERKKGKSMERDFTTNTKSELLQFIKETHDAEWVSSGWIDWVDDCLTSDVRQSWESLEEYRAKMVDKNNTTEKVICDIWNEVAYIDEIYGQRLMALNELAATYLEKLKLIQEKIKPEAIINTLQKSPDSLRLEFQKLTEKIAERQCDVEEKAAECELEKLLVRDVDGNIIDCKWNRAEEINVKKFTEKEYTILCDLEKNIRKKYGNNAYQILKLTKILGDYERYYIFGENEIINRLSNKYNQQPSRVEVYEVGENNIELYNQLNARGHFKSLNDLSNNINSLLSSSDYVGMILDFFQQIGEMQVDSLEGIDKLNEGYTVYVDEMTFSGTATEDVLINVIRIQVRNEKGEIVGEYISDIKKSVL